MADVRNYNFTTMHYNDAEIALESLIAMGGGDIEFRALRVDHPQDHLDELNSFYMSFWTHGEFDQPADTYTKRMTYRDVTVYSEVFVLPVQKEFEDYQEYKKKLFRSLSLISKDIIKFTKCHLYDGNLQIRFSSRFISQENIEQLGINDSQEDLKHVKVNNRTG